MNWEERVPARPTGVASGYDEACLSLASLYNLLVKTPFHIKQRFK